MFSFFARPQTKKTRRETTLRVESLEPRAMAAAVAPIQRPQPKPRIDYQVTVVNHGTSQVRQMAAKRNVLTLNNLPPGNYSSSYSVHVRSVDYVMAND